MIGGKTHARRAFSLVEMLVVLGILGVMLAFSTPMWMSQSSMDLNGASLRLAGFFEEARAEAVAWGEPVRVLIHDDSRDSGQFRRRIIALRRETTHVKGADSFTSWTSVLHPMITPQGIYFDPSQPGSADATMTYAESGNRETRWRFYEIAASGAMVSDTRNVVLGRGVTQPSSSQVQITDPEKVAGFRLSHRSKPIHFRTRQDIVQDAP